ncbi:MAG TPA: IPT/TIG domain-containing protein [Pyrinomonadaceae bacterium]|nr:IPT/TIG domain-containing protein [Pyrinomonadaceae bacterium]
MPNEQNEPPENEPAGPLGRPAAQGDAAEAAAQEQQQERSGQIFWRTPLDDTPPGYAFLYGTLAYLLVLMVVLLYGITAGWPVCELPQLGAAPIPSPAAAPANVNSNAGADANTSANANMNANAGADRDANANNNAINNTTTINNGNANLSPGAPAGGPAQAKLDIDDIEPKSGPIHGNTQVTIKGKGFGSAEGLVVRFGEDEARVREIKPESISVRTPMHSEGLVDVSVRRGGESDILPSAYTYTCPTPSGAGLFWMLILAGALGGCIHATRSLWWYAGQGTLKSRWMLMYFSLPFIGAAMAMLFSLLIFAGFVSNATGRGESLFIVAVAGLVGMFSQQAALKLTDIANAFFTKPGPGKDSDPQKSLSVSERNAAAAASGRKIEPATGPAATGQAVKITGPGLASASSVTFGGAAGTNFSLDESKTVVSVMAPPRPGRPGPVAVEVKDAAGKTIAELTFTYTA